MRMIVFFVLIVLSSFVFGCAPSGQLSSSTLNSAQHTILDELLARANVAGSTEQVERDLPSDTWTTGQGARPGRVNSSRSSREFALAHELIGQLKPKLKDIPARELLCSLKTFRYGTIPDNFSGVAYYVYRDGNQAIINELSTRKLNELKTLQSFQNDQSEVFTGDDGPPCSVGDIVRNALPTEPRATIDH